MALEVTITPAGAAAGTVVSRSNYKNMYWTCTQQLVHHSVTGCNMLPGDLLASGTISGAESSAYGSMLELCWQGTKEVGPLADGSVRKFLKDGDTVTIRGKCTHPSGFSIGFGECAGQVLPAGVVAPPPPLPPPAVALHDVSLLAYWRSSCSWRVRIALAFYSVAYKYTAVNLLHGEQSGVSPMAQVPRLDWTDSAGERHSLTQSLAIIEFLAEAAVGAVRAVGAEAAVGAVGAVGMGGRRSLLPLEPLARARAREIAEVINAGTQPLSNLSHMNAITAATEGADGRAIGKAAMIKGLVAAEALAARNRDCRFCVGAHTSVADLCIVPQLYNARRFGIDLAPYPRLLCVEEHAATLQYFQVAHPNVQPDAVEDAQEDAPPKRPNTEEEAR